MKTRNIATALGGALALAAATPVSAAESWSETTIKPLAATSLYAGGAHVVSYFQSIDGVCRLTMVISDKDMAMKGGAPTRVQLTVEPGRAAYVDDVDGKSSRFTCLYHAEAMNVVRADRVALSPER
jgi:hypothetical protein